MNAPASAPEVLVVVEQLRREVPGGIGTYARGILQGLADAAREGDVAVSLFASRHQGGGPDPLERFRRPLTTSRLPGPLLVRAWDRGLCRAPGPHPLPGPYPAGLDAAS